MSRLSSYTPVAVGVLACCALLGVALFGPLNPLPSPPLSTLDTTPVGGPAPADTPIPTRNEERGLGLSGELKAHQGVATIDTTTSDYWVFDTSAIRRYSWSWDLAAENSSPFSAPGTSALLPGYTDEHHLGTGAVYNGNLYLPAENWPSVTNQQILVFNAQTLQLIRSVPTSQTHEVAAVAVVPEEGPRGVLYVASYQDSSRLYKYDLGSLSYIGSLPLSPVPPLGIQGITYCYGTLFLASTGGASSLGHLTSVDRSTGTTHLLYTSTEKGTHEGIAWRDGNLLWLIDRHGFGSRVHYLKIRDLLR